MSTRAPIGYVAIAHNPIATNQGFRNIIVKDVDQANPEFLYYWLKANTLELERHASGSTFKELSGTSLKSIRLWLPPPSEQKAIVKSLNALDDKIELDTQTAKTLESMSIALFKSWFIDFDPVRAKQEGCASNLPKHLDDHFSNGFQDSRMGSIPNGWNIMTLGDMCYKPQYGYTDSAREEPVGPKFLRIKDINKSPWIDWNSVPYCQCTERDAEKYRLSYGDILISRMADPGHAVMFEGDTMRYLHRT